MRVYIRDRTEGQNLYRDNFGIVIYANSMSVKFFSTCILTVCLDRRGFANILQYYHRFLFYSKQKQNMPVGRLKSLF